MKKLLGIVFLALMASCSGNGASETAKEDSARIADSVAQVEAAKVAAEQARQDSIRQDSIAKAEEIASRLSILDFCYWESDEKVMAVKNEKKIISKLEELGFNCEKTWTENVEYCGEYFKEKNYIYLRDLNGNVTSVKLEGLEIEINFPNKELLDEFIQTALSNRFKKANNHYTDFTYVGPNEDCYWNGTDIKVSGNSVILVSRFEC